MFKGEGELRPVESWASDSLYLCTHPQPWAGEVVGWVVREGDGGSRLRVPKCARVRSPCRGGVPRQVGGGHVRVVCRSAGAERA